MTILDKSSIDGILQSIEVPHYRAVLGDAWPIVERLQKEFYEFDLTSCSGDWTASFDGEGYAFSARDRNAAIAVLKAARLVLREIGPLEMA